jgi:regulator of RNase E activity RraB
MVVITTRHVMIIQSLIEAIADAKGKDPDDLEFVLEDHISTDAIQRLDDHASESWTLQFDLPNHTVHVAGDGTIVMDGSHEQMVV